MKSVFQFVLAEKFGAAHLLVHDRCACHRRRWAAERCRRSAGAYDLRQFRLPIQEAAPPAANRQKGSSNPFSSSSQLKRFVSGVRVSGSMVGNRSMGALSWGSMVANTPSHRAPAPVSFAGPLAVVAASAARASMGGAPRPAAALLKQIDSEHSGAGTPCSGQPVGAEAPRRPVRRPPVIWRRASIEATQRGDSGGSAGVLLITRCDSVAWRWCAKRPIRPWAKPGACLAEFRAIGGSMACLPNQLREEPAAFLDSRRHQEGPLTICSRCSRPCPGQTGPVDWSWSLFAVQRLQPPA